MARSDCNTDPNPGTIAMPVYAQYICLLITVQQIYHQNDNGLSTCQY